MKIDSFAWRLMQIVGLLQGVVCSVLAQHSTSPRKRFRLEMMAMSGFLLSREDRDSLPADVREQMMVQARLLALLVLYNVAMGVSATAEQVLMMMR